MADKTKRGPVPPLPIRTLPGDFFEALRSAPEYYERAKPYIRRAKARLSKARQPQR
jgi:hypothetical protein